MPTDLEIARSVEPRPIMDVAADMGVNPEHVEQRGNGLAKINLNAVEHMGPPRAKYVLVTATNPTPFGEGKTTVSIGLAQGFKRIGEQAALTLRQPSLGPTFGIKGGAAGGGHSQVIPMEEMNLHLTGDFHAVTAANNMLAALIDNHLFQGNQMSIGIKRVTWRRVMDVNDRALRNIVVGLGKSLDGVPRETGFDITAASELMAVLGMATSLKDLRDRLGRIVIGYDRHNEPITAEDIDGAGAMAVLLNRSLVGSQGCTQSEPAPDPRRNSCADPHGTVCEHRTRQLLDRCRPGWYSGGRLPRHRGGLRVRYWCGEVLQRQMSGIWSRARCSGDCDDGARAEGSLREVHC